MGDLDDYLASVTDAASRTALEHVRDIALDVVPDAEQGTKYAMAALVYRGKGLVAPVENKHHLSVVPFSGEVVAQVADDLGGFSLSKGTIRFDAAHPVPDDVLRRVVELRRAEIDARAPERAGPGRPGPGAP
ncbi:iron chaperone [Luteimicrobium subarcticum]|uniref:Uncharacterized protein YdhG (YjbR/CyaY superfamily) n=1 Tax=Luteimicrobium subarcticum TaxID=620910 RepID=A0A2M8W1S8_9MICO|nr:DUF1801 domain-containing protein [Luteimicrobium subarcticum]PJI84874.1 uncharacterized protein YdhG (YjbR/CyaY superfamily) [Luteimicrobium subarcticum]